MGFPKFMMPHYSCFFPPGAIGYKQPKPKIFAERSQYQRNRLIPACNCTFFKRFRWIGVSVNKCVWTKRGNEACISRRVASVKQQGVVFYEQVRRQNLMEISSHNGCPLRR